MITILSRVPRASTKATPERAAYSAGMRRSHLLASAASAVLLLTVTATGAMAADAAPSASPTVSSTAATATLTTVAHTTPVPPRFTKFSYQTGTVSGVAEGAAAKINSFIAKEVSTSVASAKQQGKGPCTAGAKKCGYFQLQLTAPACVTGSVCITEPGQLLPPGANTGNAWVNTATFNAKTGELQKLDEFVGATQQADFLKAVNAGISAQLAKGGIKATDKLWKPAKKMKDIDSWSPTPEGIQLYFSKYDVAPGNFGVVQVFVPWLDFQ